jgi:hypothetical protein
MGEKLQEYLDKEKILIERNRFKDYQKEYERKIKEADNERLRSYFLEYSRDIDDGKAIQNVFSFVQWIIANK